MSIVQQTLPYIMQSTILILVGLGLAGFAAANAPRQRPTVKLKVKK